MRSRGIRPHLDAGVSVRKSAGFFEDFTAKFSCFKRTILT